MKIITLGFLLCTSLSAAGQYVAEKFEASLLQAKFGALLVYNGEKNSFSLKFISKSVEPANQPNFLTVDNVLMQSYLVPFTEKLDFLNLNEAKQIQYLKSWKEYEKSWTEEQLKVKLKDNEELITINGRKFLLWTYDMPKDNNPGSVEKQIHLITICFDQMLVLNGPVERKKSEIGLREKLISVAKTLTVTPGKVQDIDKLYVELMK